MMDRFGSQMWIVKNTKVCIYYIRLIKIAETFTLRMDNKVEYTLKKPPHPKKKARLDCKTNLWLHKGQRQWRSCNIDEMKTKWGNAKCPILANIAERDQWNCQNFYPSELFTFTHFRFCFPNCSVLLWEKIDPEKLLKFEAKGRESAKFLRSQFIWTVKGKNNFWNRMLFLTCSWRFLRSTKTEQL